MFRKNKQQQSKPYLSIGLIQKTLSLLQVRTVINYWTLNKTSSYVRGCMAYRYKVGYRVYHDHMKILAGGECQRGGKKTFDQWFSNREQRSESPRGLVKTHFPGPLPIGSSYSTGLGKNLECLFLSSQMRSRLLVQVPCWKRHTNPDRL